MLVFTCYAFLSGDDRGLGFFPNYLNVNCEVKYYLNILSHRIHYVMYLEDMESKIIFKESYLYNIPEFLIFSFSIFPLQITIPRPSVASTQSASESFHYGHQLEKREQDAPSMEHTVELSSPKESLPGVVVTEGALPDSASRPDLVLNISQEVLDTEGLVKESVNVLDCGQQDLPEQHGGIQEEKELENIPAEEVEEEKLPVVSEDAVAMQSKEQNSLPGDSKSAEEEPLTNTEAAEESKPGPVSLMPNQDEVLKSIAPKTSEISPSRLTNSHVNRQISKTAPVQENGFHSNTEEVHIQDLKCHQVALTTFLHQEDKKEKNAPRNGELFHCISEKENSHRSKKDLIKSPFVFRQSRIQF